MTSTASSILSPSRPAIWTCCSTKLNFSRAPCTDASRHASCSSFPTVRHFSIAHLIQLLNKLSEPIRFVKDWLSRDTFFFITLFYLQVETLFRYRIPSSLPYRSILPPSILSLLHIQKSCSFISFLFNRRSNISQHIFFYFGFYFIVILFDIGTGVYFYGASQQGHTTSDHQLIGSVVTTILVIVVTVQIALDTAYWTVFNHITIWGSLVWYFALQYFYNFVIGGSYVGSLTKVKNTLRFYFQTINVESNEMVFSL